MVRLDQLEVLVVDDHKLTRQLVCDILLAAGFQNVRQAKDGAEAIESLASAPTHIVITDLEMAFDGLSVLDWVRKGAQSLDIGLPLIAMTSLADKSHVLSLRDHGVNEVLVKPFSAKALLERLASVIDRPRPLIDQNAYTGPCRRRRTAADYDGPTRRSTDPRASVKI